MQKRKNNLWLVLFDTLFVMLLCFATLLTAMFFKTESSGGMLYLINVSTLCITFGALALYFAYLLPLSDKGLQSTVNALYSNKAHEQMRPPAGKNDNV